MKTIRRIDYCGQLILAALMVLSIPFCLLPGFIAGLFMMGCWQVISASLNTHSFMRFGYKKQISLYWTLCIGDIALLFLSIWPGQFFNPDGIPVVIGIPIAGSVPIAAYYCKIYFTLTEHIELKNELAGLLKSK